MRGVVFADRREAGRLLAERLTDRLPDLRARRPVVLGVPRGGVVVAAEVASALDAPLDVIMAGKVGAPFNPELAVGAVAPGGVLLVNNPVARQLGVEEGDLTVPAREKEQEMAERLARFRQGRPAVELVGRTAILVDDGVATGLTLAAAILSLRRQEPAAVILAAPVASREAVSYLQTLVDEVVCLLVPPDFIAVGRYYEDFGETSVEDVVRLLAQRNGGV